MTDSPLNSLGFAKPPAQTRVVVAMSGGVDSSVVAAQLASEGYDVVGVTLQLYDHGRLWQRKVRVAPVLIFMTRAAWLRIWVFRITCWIMKTSFKRL